MLAQAKALDKQINALEFENTAIIQDIFGKYSPRGHDLRFIIGSVKLSTLLESMADKTKNNIKRIGKAEALPSPSIAAHAQEMLEESTALLTLLQQLLHGFSIEISDAMVARRRRIEALYREIWLQQTQVDVSYHNLVMLAKNIERNADILSDIRKILYFIHTGEKLVKKKKAALS
jgi:phosphate uptake regulator